MENALSNPATLTPLALVGLVIVQIVQLIRGHLDAKAGREVRHDDNLASILQKVLDQHAQAWGGLASTLGEIQAHMRATNTALSSFTHRLEAVERQLAAPPDRTRSSKDA